MSDREGTPEEETVEEYPQGGSTAGAEEEEEEEAAGEREEEDDGRKSREEGSPEEEDSREERRRRSRSRSSRSSRRRHRHYSRSHSRSPRRSRYYYSSRSRRSHSRSPMSNRRRHVGSRDNPNTSRCLGVFGLSLYTQERDLKEVFSKYGPLEDVQVVYDAQVRPTAWGRTTHTLPRGCVPGRGESKKKLCIRLERRKRCVLVPPTITSYHLALHEAFLLSAPKDFETAPVALGKSAL